ncbi:hypothetical protein LC653_28750 [Nostoc sp. CHAB 5784]|uniref:globin domain-containing protein n=1 Tax=Nostoc mirabile TaxID=2907820 RepID=UPI001E28CE1C|nr:globin domain-containing protein [Nostoc mirabile]MCC5667761.1 hypothetical protein [Nostoc mirabile CHAB5784]
MTLLVESLRTPEALVAVLKDLGARHKGYGILREYYPVVGEILLTTFAEYLQEDWTLEVAEAWVNTYTTISQLMLEGAGINGAVKLEQPEIKAIPFPPLMSETVSPKRGRRVRTVRTVPEQRNLSKVIR